MKKCKTCYLINAKPCYECSACASGDDHYKYWPNTQTNADRIRSMSDEELTGSNSQRRRNIVRLIDEIAYQEKIAKIPIEERTFVKAWETAQDMPTIDAVPVVRGEWIDTYADDKEIGDFVKHCSICHNAIIKMLSASLKYCPNCGARMEDKPCG